MTPPGQAAAGIPENQKKLSGTGEQLRPLIPTVLDAAISN